MPNARMTGRVPASAIALVALAFVPARLARAAEPPLVRYDEGLVTVHAVGASRPEVIETLGREAALVIRGDVLDARPLSKRFTDLALPEALDRLLGDQNFLLVYDDDGIPRRVQLLGLPKPRATPAVRAHPAPNPRRPRYNPATVAALTNALGNTRRLGLPRVVAPQGRR